MRALGRLCSIAAVIDDPQIEELRRSIDAVDQQILTLLAERLRVVLAVGERKRREGLAVYDPAREKSLLDRLASEAPAPLEAEAVRRIFETIVTESRRLEHEHMTR